MTMLLRRLLQLVLLQLSLCNAFVVLRGPSTIPPTSCLNSQKAPSNNNNNNNDAAASTSSSSSSSPNIDRDLLPPTVNVRKESILFGDDPATAQNNNALKLWRQMKEGLPYVFTGAQPTTADDNPLGGIYNVLFVRLPTVLMGCVYGKNLVEGHPLIIDLGWSGPSEVPPLIVFGALFVILR